MDMTFRQMTPFGKPAQLKAPERAADGPGGFFVVCEHASNFIPEPLAGLGLSAEALQAHIAWDPGALGVAAALADLLGAPLLYGGISRLVYDCNRPPEAPDAVPARSEIYEIPGNARLDAAARARRVEGVYRPFQRLLAGEIAARLSEIAALVTIHSFTPVYLGAPRAVEIGLLHGEDPRLAHAMLALSPAENVYDTRLNEPYSAADGVVHTIDLHGSANGVPNLMIEIRSDLIATPEAERAMAALLAPWLRRARDAVAGRRAS